jgi:hypothetical protein
MVIFHGKQLKEPDGIYWKISIGLFFKGKSTHQMHENWEKTSMSWKHPAIVNGHATGT